jgi:hypothetical protein
MMCTNKEKAPNFSYTVLADAISLYNAILFAALINLFIWAVYDVAGKNEGNRVPILTGIFLP